MRAHGPGRAPGNLTSTVRPILRRGSTGPAVLAWQQSLLGESFVVTANSRFDETTENATKAFQRASELEETGVVGPETSAAMIEAEKD